MNETPTQIRSYRPDVPRELDAIVLRALEREPADRFASAAAFAEALAPFAGAGDGRELTVLANGSARADPHRPRRLARRWVLIAVAPLVLGAISGALGARLLGSGPGARAHENHALVTNASVQSEPSVPASVALTSTRPAVPLLLEGGLPAPAERKPASSAPASSKTPPRGAAPSESARAGPVPSTLQAKLGDLTEELLQSLDPRTPRECREYAEKNCRSPNVANEARFYACSRYVEIVKDVLNMGGGASAETCREMLKSMSAPKRP